MTKKCPYVPEYAPMLKLGPYEHQKRYVVSNVCFKVTLFPFGRSSVERIQQQRSYMPAMLWRMMVPFPYGCSAAQVCKVMFSVAIFVTYALQCYVPFDVLWVQRLKPALEKSSHILLWEYVFRAAIVGATCEYACMLLSHHVTHIRALRFG